MIPEMMAYFTFTLVFGIIIYISAKIIQAITKGSIFNITLTNGPINTYSDKVEFIKIDRPLDSTTNTGMANSVEKYVVNCRATDLDFFTCQIELKEFSACMKNK